MNYRGRIWDREGGQDGVEWGGGKWDNCNSIISKYILKIKKRRKKKKETLKPEVNVKKYY